QLVLVIDSGIHPDEIRSTKGIGRNRPGLHLPSSIKNLGGLMSYSPPNSCRNPIFIGPYYRIRYSLAKKLQVFWIRVTLKNRTGSSPRMGMRGGHQHVFDGNIGKLMGPLFGF